MVVIIKKSVPFDGFSSSRLILDFLPPSPPPAKKQQTYDLIFTLKIVNALRRIACCYVPTYGFAPENITITENTSVAFNNDMMKLRLSTLPIFGVNDPAAALTAAEPKTITAYLNIANHAASPEEILNVTTHDLIVKINDVISPMYTKAKPILLIKLTPKNKFTCSMVASIGTGSTHTLWAAATNGYHEVLEEENLVRLTLETPGKLDLMTLYQKSHAMFVSTLQTLKENIPKIMAESKNQGDGLIILELENIDYAIADIINYEFQSTTKHFNFSGITKPDLLKNVTVIKLLPKPEGHALKYILSCFDTIIEKLEQQFLV